MSTKTELPAVGRDNQHRRRFRSREASHLWRARLALYEAVGAAKETGDGVSLEPVRDVCADILHSELRHLAQTPPERFGPELYEVRRLLSAVVGDETSLGDWCPDIEMLSKIRLHLFLFGADESRQVGLTRGDFLVRSRLEPALFRLLATRVFLFHDPKDLGLCWEVSGIDELDRDDTATWCYRVVMVQIFKENL